MNPPNNIKTRSLYALSIAILLIIVAVTSSLVTSTFINQKENGISSKIVTTVTPTTENYTTNIPTSSVITTTNPLSQLKTFQGFGFKIDYPSDWSYKGRTITGQPDIVLNSNSLESTLHKAEMTFSKEHYDDFFGIHNYDGCISVQGGAAAGHGSTPAVLFTINNTIKACKYTAYSTDGIVNVVNTYLYLQDSNKNFENIIYGERSKLDAHDYTIDKWIYTDKFDAIINSFRFV